MKDVLFRTLMLKGQAGGTIKSIEKIDAEGGVMQMRMTLSDGETIDFPVNDVPDENLINNLIEIALAPVESTLEDLTDVIETTLSAGNWTSSAPYTYTLSAEGVTAADNYEIVGFTPTASADTNKYIKEALGFITYGETSANTITFYAVEDKPLYNIPIVLRKVVKGGS